jgi:CBS-domain-containing membrane protein
MREYSVDPLEALFVRDVVPRDLYTVAAGSDVADLRRLLEYDLVARRQKLYPVTNQSGTMVGVIGSSDLAGSDAIFEPGEVDSRMHTGVVTAYLDETLRSVADRMAEHRLGALPVVDRSAPGRVLGVVTSFELLAARRRQLEEERRRDRTLRLRVPTYPRIRPIVASRKQASTR